MVLIIDHSINSNIMSKRQDIAKDFIQLSGLPQAFYAKKLGLKPQNFSYHLNESPELDRDLFDNIMKLIMKYADIEIGNSIPEPYKPSLVREESSVEYRPDRIKEFTLPILADVPAGPGEFNEYTVFETITFDRDKHFFLRVDPLNGDSMAPIIKPGDLVICEYSTKIKDGDIVAVKYDDVFGSIKIFIDFPADHSKIFLRGMNPANPPLLLNKKTVFLWKVIQIVKN